MPLYEYHCPTCDDAVEVLVRASDSTVECPTCSTALKERLMSVTARPAVQGASLPVCPTPSPMPRGGGCGLPQCGQGRCAGME